MSTTVNYKGNTIATLSNETKMLNTAGTWVEDNIEIIDSSASISLQSKTATPTESSQTITPDTGYDGLSSVQINAISSSYIGSGVSRKTSNDITEEVVDSANGGLLITAPTGYYANDATKLVPYAGYPELNHILYDRGDLIISIDIPSAGYISEAEDLLLENILSISDISGFPINDDSDVTVSGDTVTISGGYYGGTVSKSVASGTTGTPSASKGTVSNHSISVTPSVTNTTGYITGGTKTGTAVTVTASELASGNKEITSNGTNIDVVGYSTVSVAVPGASLQAKTGINPTTSSQTITADSGYDGLSSVQINAMPSGSASTPATTITANPSITVSSSGLITATASASQNITPTVSAGYVSSGTAGTITVSGSKTQQLTTKGATTITPTKSSQTAVASGVYTTGAITVAAIPSNYITTTDATASASDILSGETAYVNGSKVTGTLTFSTVTVSSSAPSGGANGDVWIKTS